MAALEYEVRDEYKTYGLAQLLEAPVTCFQGVGDIQSEILQRYFGVTTVQELAHLAPFLQALNVQEIVLEGGDTLHQTVSAVAAKGDPGFQIRTADQMKEIAELPAAPVHVLEGLTPAQDLAFYDAFRITSLTQLAQNRIMLEARVIEYLAGQGGRGKGAGSGGADDPVAAILGARAASAAAGQARARAGGFEPGQRTQNLASEVTEHVRGRVTAMRDRAHDRAGTVPGEGAGGGAMSRISAIRESREHAPTARAESTERARTGLGRTEQIMASRGTSGASGGSARSVADHRTGFGPSRVSAGSSRADTVLSARQGFGSGGAPQAAHGGATVRSRPPAGAAGATATATRPGTAGKVGATGATAGAGADARLKTEAQAAATGGTQAPTGTRRRQPQPNPVPIIAAAVIALLLLAGLIWFLMSGNGKDATPTTAGTGAGDQTTVAGAPGTAGPTGGGTAAGTSGAAGTQGVAGTSGAAGTQGVAGTSGAAGTSMGTPAAGGLKGTVTVRRGDTLWFISKKEYADPLNWPSIFMENKDQIRNPDLIHPQQKLRIPSAPEYRFPDYPKGYRATR